MKIILSRKGFDSDYGARPLSRLIQAKVKNVLSEEILFGKLTNGGLVTVGLNEQEDNLTFEYT